MRAFLVGVAVVLAANVLIAMCNRMTSQRSAQGASEAPGSSDAFGRLLGRTLGARPQAQWVDLAPLQDPRQEVGVAALDGRIYVVGGFRGDGGTVSTVEVYNPSADRWEFVAPLPIAVNHAVAAVVGDRLYVLGGHPPAGPEAVDNVFAYDPSSDTWAPRASMPTARGALSVAVADGKIYAAGGSPTPRENDFAVYDPTADTWTMLPPMPTPRNHLAAGSLNGKVYVAGGRSDLSGITGVLEEYDPTTNAWTQRTAMPTPRGGIAAASANGLLYVFGGEGNRSNPRGIFDQVEAYDPTSDSWQRLAPMGVPRHGISAATLGNRIYIPGGATVEGFGVTAANQALQLE
jgi:N-acetylneuraminic acid mutarotase